MSTAIAERLQSDPSLIEVARSNIERWRQTCSSNVQLTLNEWLDILNGPVDGVIQMLTDTSERATRLRQSNPFAGVLPEKVRNDILLWFESNDTTPA